MSTILNALNKVQAERLSKIQQENAKHEQQLRVAARRAHNEDARSEVEKLLEKLREDFRNELFFLREENRLLSEKLVKAEQPDGVASAKGIKSASDLALQGKQLAAQAGLRYCEDVKKELDPEVADLLPQTAIERLRCLPLRRSAGGYIVAMVNPMNVQHCEELERLLDAEVVPVVVEMKAILRFLANSKTTGTARSHILA